MLKAARRLLTIQCATDNLMLGIGVRSHEHNEEKRRTGKAEDVIKMIGHVNTKHIAQ